MPYNPFTEIKTVAIETHHPMPFMLITPTQAKALNLDQDLAELTRKSLIDDTCMHCDNPVWRMVDNGMCFCCTTGESDPSMDYELIPEQLTDNLRTLEDCKFLFTDTPDILYVVITYADNKGDQHINDPLEAYAKLQAVLDTSQLTLMRAVIVSKHGYSILMWDDVWANG